MKPEGGRGQTGVGLLDLAAGLGTLPLSVRLRVALDVLDALAGKRPVKVAPRKKGSRLDIQNVVVAARGRGKLVGRGNRSGVQILLWEILACRMAKGKKPPPLSAVESDMEPEIEAVIERSIAGDPALADVGDLAKELVIASAGQVAQHRELAKLVGSFRRKPRIDEAAETIRTPLPVSVIDDELDKAVTEALSHGITDGWENLLERTRSSAPPAVHARPIIDDPSTFDGDELIEEIADEPTLEEGTFPPVAKAAIRTPPPVPKKTPPPLPRQAPRPARPDVLLIEPDEPTAAHVSGLLRREGFTVEICPDADDAVLKAVATQPRCIVCDEDSLGMSGLLVAERTRKASPRASLAPFVFVGNRRSKNKTGGRAASRDVWLKKPFSMTALLEHVRKLTGVKVETPSQRPPSIAPPVGQTAIDGDLSLFSLRTVLAMLEIDRQSGVLLVRSQDREARLTLQKGVVTQGTVVGRKKRPADALETILTWDSGRFSFQMVSDVTADRWVSSSLQPKALG